MVSGGPIAIERVAAIAREAGAAILEIYGAAGAAPPFERKADRSPITAADRAAHAAIVGALRALDPAIPIVSEEGEIPDAAARRAWERFWLLDPLDGTKEFIARNGEFTVNIALVARAAGPDGAYAPVLGVVYAPALGTLWRAEAGRGAWREEGTRAARICSRRARPGEPLVVVESHSHPSPELDRFLATIPVARRVAAGSALKFCWVAEGRADVYPRFGPTMEWDTAAGDCVWRWSVGDGEPPRASPLRYNTPELRNPPFVLGLEGTADGG